MSYPKYISRSITRSILCFFCVLSTTLPLPPTYAQPTQEECAQPIPGSRHDLPIEAPHHLSQGRGVQIAVIDTGAQTPHVLGDNRDCAIHGTVVASIIRRIAPAATIHSLYHGEEQRNDVSTLIQAIDRAVELGVHIINISTVTCSPIPELKEALLRTQDQGIFVNVAAGNSGQCSDSAMYYPARWEEFFTTGAIDISPASVAEASTGSPNAGKVPAPYSIPGPWVDLYAPGGPVSALWEDGSENGLEIIGSTASPHSSYSAHSEFIGTSFATPAVSAVAALIKEILPDISPIEIGDILSHTSIPAASLSHGEQSPLSEVNGAVSPPLVSWDSSAPWDPSPSTISVLSARHAVEYSRAQAHRVAYGKPPQSEDHNISGADNQEQDSDSSLAAQIALPADPAPLPSRKIILYPVGVLALFTVIGLIRRARS